MRGESCFGARARAIVAVLAFALAAAAIALAVSRRFAAPGSPEPALADFRDAYYYSALALRDGRNPYDVAAYEQTYPVRNFFPVYGPVTLLVHLPLTLLPYPAAAAVDLVVNLALCVLLAWLCLRGAGRRPTVAAVFACATVVLVCRPGLWTVYLGQCTLLVATGVYLALGLAGTHPLVAAAGLALTSVKPPYAVPLALLLLARGERRTVGLGALLAAGLGIGPLVAVVAAAGGPLAFVESLRGNLDAFVRGDAIAPVTAIYRIDLPALVGRLAGRSDGLQEALVGVAVLAAAALALRRLRRRDGAGARMLGDWIACTAILLASYQQMYNAVLLAYPVLALATARLQPPAPRAWRMRGTLLALLLVPFALNYLASQRAVHALALGPAGLMLAASLNAAALLAAFAMMLALARDAVAADAPARACPVARVP